MEAKLTVPILAVLAVICFEQRVEACDFCDAEIVLSRPLATCFLQRVEAEVATMKKAGLEYQLINLTSCWAAEKTGERGGGSQSVVDPAELMHSDSERALEVSSSFLLDQIGLRCLERYIEENLNDQSPALVFRRIEMCADER